MQQHQHTIPTTTEELSKIQYHDLDDGSMASPGAIRIIKERGSDEESTLYSLATPIAAEVVDNDSIMAVRLAELEAELAQRREVDAKRLEAEEVARRENEQEALQRQEEEDDSQKTQEEETRSLQKQRRLFLSGLGGACILLALIAAVTIFVLSRDDDDTTTRPNVTRSVNSSMAPSAYPSTSPSKSPTRLLPTLLRPDPTAADCTVIGCPNESYYNMDTGACQTCRGLLLQSASVILNVGTAVSDDYGIGNIVDQRGLEFGYLSGVTLFGGFAPLHSYDANSTEFFGTLGLSGVTFTLNLDAVAFVNTIKLWNEEGQRASLIVSVSINNVDFETVGEFMPRVNPTVVADYPRQDIFFASVVEAQYVRIVMNDCQSSLNVQCTMGEIALRQY